MLRTALLFLAVASTAWSQPVLFVDADATGSADGSSWADAFPDLQQVLAIAEAGDEVWVAEGTYRPALTADRDASFVLVSGVGLYGGFDGTETERDGRSPETNVTVLSGDLGVPDDISDNAYHVVTASGVDGSTLLDGFTVTGGYGNGANPRNRGGGVYAENSSLVVRDCRIVENVVVQTDGFGGGGGAFFGTTGSPRFEWVVFERNEGVGALGGELWLHEGASGFIEDATFIENRAASGGGLFGQRGAAFTVVRTVFVRNVANRGGGGVSFSTGEGHLVNAGFYGNVARQDDGDNLSSAGGMVGFSVALSLTNVTFVGNTARLGAGFSQSGGTSTLDNTTFTANEAEEFGGIRLSNGADITAHNAVLWGNTGGEIDEVSGSTTLRHVLIAGGCPPDPPGPPSGTTCESILDTDPLFMRAPSPGADSTWGTSDDDYGDLRLQEGSPAVDFGLTEFLPADTFDLDSDGDTEEPLPLDLAGEPRVVGESVDLGVYERPGPVASEGSAVPSDATAKLEAYPNPFRERLTVAFELPQAGPFVVEMVDVLGRVVRRRDLGVVPAGRREVALGGDGLPAGVYVVRIAAGEERAVRRVVRVR